jgi:hypothetical protein
MVARERAAIIRFRVKNLSGLALSDGITSDTRAPFSSISSKSLSLPAGYFTVTPDAKIA